MSTNKDRRRTYASDKGGYVYLGRYVGGYRVGYTKSKFPEYYDVSLNAKLDVDSINALSNAAFAIDKTYLHYISDLDTGSKEIRRMTLSNFYSGNSTDYEVVGSFDNGVYMGINSIPYNKTSVDLLFINYNAGLMNIFSIINGNRSNTVVTLTPTYKVVIGLLSKYSFIALEADSKYSSWDVCMKNIKYTYLDSDDGSNWNITKTGYIANDLGANFKIYGVSGAHKMKMIYSNEIYWTTEDTSYMYLLKLDLTDNSVSQILKLRSYTYGDNQFVGGDNLLIGKNKDIIMVTVDDSKLFLTNESSSVKQLNIKPGFTVNSTSKWIIHQDNSTLYITVYNQVSTDFTSYAITEYVWDPSINNTSMTLDISDLPDGVKETCVCNIQPIPE